MGCGENKKVKKERVGEDHMCSSICRGVWQPGGAGMRLEEFWDLQDAAASWPGWAWCGGYHCQQDKIWNHHGNRSLDISVSEILKWVPELRRLTATVGSTFSWAAVQDWIRRKRAMHGCSFLPAFLCEDNMTNHLKSLLPWWTLPSNPSFLQPLLSGILC